LCARITAPFSILHHGSLIETPASFLAEHVASTFLPCFEALRPSWCVISQPVSLPIHRSLLLYRKSFFAPKPASFATAAWCETWNVKRKVEE
jgi:hypothetical protein